MKKPVIVVLGILSVGVVVAGVALIGVFWHHVEGWGPPPSPWRHGMQECLLAPEELPPPVTENLDRMGVEERERAFDFLRDLRPGQRREALRELGECPAPEFRDRLGGMMVESPHPLFLLPLVLLFFGSLGLAVTLYLVIRKRDRGPRLERCPHCGRPVEAGWNYCPYCTGPLGSGKGSTDADSS
ncbi:MAG TPA: zinc-ribbon domain-containing protein [bacterium]|nr:zinc-ribbon domain-containing protein [bacterium]